MIMLALALLAADPSSLSSAIAAARPGDTVTLVKGNYPPLTIKSRTFDPPLKIDATEATFAMVQIIGTTGIHWKGGSITGDATLPVAVGHGFSAIASRDIAVHQVRFSYFRAGVVFDRVEGGRIGGNWFANMSSDGIDVASSRRLRISHNACSEFAPGPDAHPDCIQLWSRPSEAPTGDIEIVGNSIVGTMQGISLFNHVRDGVDDGGFDRVAITGNTVLNTFANGIAAVDCRGCAIRNNSVGSLPNYENRAQLYVVGGSVNQCGNDVPMVPRQGTPPCPTGG